MIFRCILIALFILAGGSAAAAQSEPEVVRSFGAFDVLGDSRNVLEVGVGFFDIADRHSVEAVKIEGRLGRKLSFVGPALGVVANREGGVFGYMGAYVDIAVGRFTLTPLGGIGAYHKGDSKDLGGFFIFRSGLSVAYRLSERLGIGAAWGHVSNARIYNSNPGQDDLFVTLQWRF